MKRLSPVDSVDEMARHWRVVAVVAGLLELASRIDREQQEPLDGELIADAANLILEEAAAMRACMRRWQECTAKDESMAGRQPL